MECMPHLDLLIGNHHEANAFAQAMRWDDLLGDYPAIAARIARLPKTTGAHDALQNRRVAVITVGGDPTVVATDTDVYQVPIVPVPKERLVDTNGAGDSFVGGFLAQMVVHGRPKVPDLCAAGHYAASVVVQHQGCSYPAKPQYSLVRD